MREFLSGPVGNVRRSIVVSGLLLCGCGGGEEEFYRDAGIPPLMFADGSAITEEDYVGAAFRGYTATAGRVGQQSFGAHVIRSRFEFDDEDTIFATFDSFDRVYRFDSSRGVYVARDGSELVLTSYTEGLYLVRVTVEDPAIGEALSSFGFVTPMDRQPDMAVRYNQNTDSILFIDSPETNGLVLVVEGSGPDLTIDFGTSEVTGSLFSGSRPIDSGELTVDLDIRGGTVENGFIEGRLALNELSVDGVSLNPGLATGSVYGAVYGNDADAIAGAFGGVVRADTDYGVGGRSSLDLSGAFVAEQESLP